MRSFLRNENCRTFLDGLVDGLTLITSDSKLPKEKWAPIAEVPEIREAISVAETADGVDFVVEPTAGVGAGRSNSAEPSKEFSIGQNKLRVENVSVERKLSSLEAPNSIVEASAKPDGDVAAMQEAKRLSRKRRRAANRLRKRAATSVYVTGVPKDATVDEIAGYFSKCGIILPSSEDGRPRVKLYKTESGKLKGDALITYALAPSVENAVQLLDGVPLRFGGTNMSVQPATFEHKDQAETHEVLNKALDGAKRPRRDGGSQAIVEEALSWAEDGQEQSRAPRIVILKNVFNPNDADYSVIEEDMHEGCADFGEVEKITVFERSPEGAVAIKFATAAAATQCIQVMDNRWYDKRQLSAAFF